MLAKMALLMDKTVEGAQRGVQAGGQMGEQMGRQMEGMMRGEHGGSFLWEGLGVAVVWAVVILLVLWIVRNWSNPNNRVASFLRGLLTSLQPSDNTVRSSAVSSQQTPLEVLQSRYAKGEISREEYQAIRADLASEVPAAPVSEASTAQAGA